MRNDTPRQIVRSRTTMSYAFEAAVNAFVQEVLRTGVSESRVRLARTIASAVGESRSKKTPTWTVSKKERRR